MVADVGCHGGNLDFRAAPWYLRNHRVVTGLNVSVLATDGAGTQWYIDVVGGFSNARPGLSKPDTAMKTIARAAVIHASQQDTPLVERHPYLVLSTDRPGRGAAGAVALQHVTGIGEHCAIFDSLQLLVPADIARLTELGSAGFRAAVASGPDS